MLSVLVRCVSLYFSGLGQVLCMLENESALILMICVIRKIARHPHILTFRLVHWMISNTTTPHSYTKPSHIRPFIPQISGSSKERKHGFYRSISSSSLTLEMYMTRYSWRLVRLYGTRRSLGHGVSSIARMLRVGRSSVGEGQIWMWMRTTKAGSIRDRWRLRRTLNLKTIGTRARYWTVGRSGRFA